VEQELLTLPEHMSSTPVFVGVCDAYKDRQAKKQQHYNHKDRQKINIITTTKIGKQKNNNITTTKIGKRSTSLQPQR
jgi:hypothetical protein